MRVANPMAKAKRKGTRAKGRSASSDDEVLLGPVVDFLHEHITEELCRLVFDAVRVTERARKWTLFALARFWLAVVLEPRREDHAAQAPGLTRLVHDLVAELGGSFSAEHGVGRLKVEELRRYADPARLAAMRAIKAALDPAGIMNPGAVLG